MKKVDKEQWFIIGLDVLAKDGFARITIDNLCGLLQITKGAFYHHFKNIDRYIDALMKYWLEVNTIQVIEDADKLHNINDQQQKLADMAAYASMRNESVIRAWGYSNPIVRNYVSQADKIRLEYAAKLNEATGLDAKQAMDLAIIQYSLLIGMQQVCSTLSPKQFKKLQDMAICKFKNQKDENTTGEQPDTKLSTSRLHRFFFKRGKL